MDQLPEWITKIEKLLPAYQEPEGWEVFTEEYDPTLHYFDLSTTLNDAVEKYGIFQALKNDFLGSVLRVSKIKKLKKRYEVVIDDYTRYNNHFDFAECPTLNQVLSGRHYPSPYSHEILTKAIIAFGLQRFRKWLREEFNPNSPKDRIRKDLHKQILIPEYLRPIIENILKDRYPKDIVLTVAALTRINGFEQIPKFPSFGDKDIEAVETRKRIKLFISSLRPNANIENVRRAIDRFDVQKKDDKINQEKDKIEDIIHERIKQLSEKS
jgi:hypothetical protein